MVSDSAMYRRRIKEQEPERYAQYLAKQSAAIKSRREREKKLPLAKARELLLEKRRARESECTARYHARKRSGQPIQKKKERKCVKEMTDEERREHVRRLRAESRARQSDERKQSLREWNREYARRKRAQTRVAKSTYLSDSPQSLPMALDSDVENYQVKPEIEFDRDDSSQLKTEFDLHKSQQLTTEFLHNESPQIKTELHKDHCTDLKNEFFQDDSPQLKTDYLQDLSPEIKTELSQENTGSLQNKSPQPETELSVVRSQELKNELSLNDSLQGRTEIFPDMSPSQPKTKLPQNESQKPEFRVREHVRYKTRASKRADKSNSLVALAQASPPHTTSAANVQKDQKLEIEYPKDDPHYPSFMHHRSHQQHMFHQHLQKDHVDSSLFRESPKDMTGKRQDLMGSIMVSDSAMYRQRIKEQEPERYAQYLAKQSAAIKSRREREKKLPMTKARKLLLEERRVRQNERTARYRARKTSGQPIMVQVRKQRTRKQRTCLKNMTDEERREHKRRLRAESRARQSDEKRQSMKKKNTEYSRRKRAQSSAANSAPHTDLPQFLPTVFAMEVENKQEPKTEFDSVTSY